MKKPASPPKPRQGLVAALDVGSTKVSCVIARVDPRAGDRLAGGTAALADELGKAEIVGFGHQRSQGMRGGSVVDIDAAEGAVRRAVEAAETMAGENIKKVLVGLSCGQPQSELTAHEVQVGGAEITDQHLHRVLGPTVSGGAEGDERQVIHAIPVGYRVDESRGIRDPRGMHGEWLGVSLHLMTARRAAVKNLRAVVARCHLDIDAFVATPYASALATLIGDERQLGTTCIDLGGGTTSLSVFFDGELVHGDVIPVGGLHMTSDIARGLSTPIDQAERLKVLYGSAIPASADETEMIPVPVIGEDAARVRTQVPRSMVVGIVRPRAEEIFELLRDRLKAAGVDQVIGQRVVLTGGGSQLSGMAELAGDILGRRIRVAQPKVPPFVAQGMNGKAEGMRGSGFSTVLGLIRYAQENPAEVSAETLKPMQQTGGALGRFSQWLRENF